MNAQEWSEWVRFHASMFSFTTETDREMFAAWRVAFTAAGFTLAELRDATMFLAKNPPRWRVEHLAQIQARIAQERIRAAKAMEEANSGSRDFAMACDLCGNSGFVPVPHPKTIVGGEWIHPYALVAAYCSCVHGKRIFNSHGERQVRGIPIENYELINPHWRQLVAQKVASDHARAKAKAASQAVDFKFGAVLQSVIDSAKKQGETWKLN